MAAITPDPTRIRAFDGPEAFNLWLAENHDGPPELWLKIFKKATGLPTITYAEAVTVGLCWGWIDGLKKGYDDRAFLQRFSPRKPGSLWSMINRRQADQLIADGRMRPPGMARIEEARANGRWQGAYLGADEAETPADFLSALSTNPAARTTYETMTGSNLYAIYFRLQTAPSAKARADRFEKLIAMLEAGRTPH